jgi:hypothetical protein
MLLATVVMFMILSLPTLLTRLTLVEAQFFFEFSVRILFSECGLAPVSWTP